MYNITIKKMIFILFAFGLHFHLGSCRKEPIEKSLTISVDLKSEPLSLDLTNKDFNIYLGHKCIKLGDYFKKLEINEKLLNFKDIDENNLYQIFEYKNFTFIVSQLKKPQIMGINLISQNIATTRGVKVGDNLSKVFEEYGKENGFLTDNCMMYQFEGKFISFYFDEKENIWLIKLELI